MRVLIIPDSFKHSLSSQDVGKCIETGFLEAVPNAEISLIPVSDGGEGFTHAIVGPLKGEILNVPVHDALLRPIEAFIGILPDKCTAIIEMAAASGIERINCADRDPLSASTHGTGELILAALDQGCTKIIMGIGGSATNDGGVGMAMALGVRFRDADQNLVPQGGEHLNRIKHIDTTHIDPRIKTCELLVACDVTNPLYGPYGASRVYGPQKGATPEMVEKLELGLVNLASVIKRNLYIEVSELRGGGAAGGLGAGLVAFAGAKLLPGFTLLSELLSLESQIKKCQIVITAEGQFDSQSAHGKLTFAVAELAHRNQRHVFIFTGANQSNDAQLVQKFGASVLSICQKPCTVQESMLLAKDWLTLSAFNLANALKTGQNL